MAKNQHLLFGFYVDAVRIDEVVERCRSAVSTRDRLLLGVLNAAKVVKARHDPMLRNSLMQCDLLLADGQSVVWASRLLRRALPERVTGIDVFERLLALADRERRSVYLLGATEEVLARVLDHLRRHHPGIRIAGSHHGYFSETESDAVADDIRAGAPDMLFIGMTSPKKENFLARYGNGLNVPVLHGVGGSFDILAGVARRAPAAWQHLGMEWAYRVLQEPGRLWWRYLGTNTAFVFLTLREMVRPTRAYQLVRFAAPRIVEPGSRRS